jgi:hypothetical protein
MSDGIYIPPVTLEPSRLVSNDIVGVERTVTPPDMAVGGVSSRQGRGWQHGRYVGLDDRGRTRSMAEVSKEMQFGRDRISGTEPMLDPGNYLTTRQFTICDSGTPKYIDIYVNGDPYT